MGLPVGADVAIIYGGVLASGQIPNEPHHLNVIVVIVVATLAEVLGSRAISSAISAEDRWVFGTTRTPLPGSVYP